VFFDSEETMRQAARVTRWPVIDEEIWCLRMVRHERDQNVIITWDETGDATYFRFYEVQIDRETSHDRTDEFDSTSSYFVEKYNAA